MLALKNSYIYNYLISLNKQPFKSMSEATQSELFASWWFYDAEIYPGLKKEGIFPDYFPLPARVLMRNAVLSGMDCLDIGSMEGIIPILMKKQNAREVVATDFDYFCYNKMSFLKRLHNVDFKFKRIGLLYDLINKFPEKKANGYDFINLSGVLYHVFSPMQVIAGIRPLLKKNGLIVITTNVINRNDYSMEFNNSGKLQEERNTFWYLSINYFDYMLKYFQLKPVDYFYYQHSNNDKIRYTKDYEAGYLGVVARAVDDRGMQFNDEWLYHSINNSWEYKQCYQDIIDNQPYSKITYKNEQENMSLSKSINCRTILPTSPSENDTHFLKINDLV